MKRFLHFRSDTGPVEELRIQGLVEDNRKGSLLARVNTVKNGFL